MYCYFTVKSIETMVLCVFKNLLLLLLLLYPVVKEIKNQFKSFQKNDNFKLMVYCDILSLKKLKLASPAENVQEMVFVNFLDSQHDIMLKFNNSSLFENWRLSPRIY